MSRSSPKALLTPYQGYNFRSRLEARWAVFFDHLGIRWGYEAEGYDLGNGMRYLPDFWLPDFKSWVEVKPGPPDDAALAKAKRLTYQTGFPLFMANGMPDAPGLGIDFFGGSFSSIVGEALRIGEKRMQAAVFAARGAKFNLSDADK